jgi:hypothetical protein
MRGVRAKPEGRLEQTQSAFHTGSVVAAVEFLCTKHGQAGAHKLALLEQKRARRARSRKRFNFWAAVVAQLDGASEAADDSGARRRHQRSERIASASVRH